MKAITKKRNGLGLLAVMLACLVACAMALSACGGSSTGGAPGQPGSSGSGEKAFVYGTTGYGTQMDDAGLNPHDTYSGWSAVRYGVGETLFKFSDSMQPEPWLATGYEFTSDTTCKITLRDDVNFSSGRHMTATAVKECLDDLIAVHDRAPADTKISNVEADDASNAITITTSEPCPALINYLSDPYGAIIDMQAGVSPDGNVSGTGPYMASSVSDTEITLTKNEHYWNGTPKMDRVIVRAITDGDTLTSALQSGEIHASYGLPYASYALFKDGGRYTINSCDTSRVFFGQMNYASPVMQDDAVRKAICQGIDRQGFVDTLLSGRGSKATGPFPDEFAFGDATVRAEDFDPEAAKATLEAAGWVDSDGDGVRERDGQRLTVRWLTYPGRMELPLLAESVQSTLGAIGFDVQVNSTANHTTIRKDATAWDVYASALVSAPTGDPEYFFGTHAIQGVSANYGGYHNAKIDTLYRQLHEEFDSAKRAELGTQMTQQILDDHGMVFVSHLTMGIVSDARVSGMRPHPCDYYEITVDLDMT